MKLEEAPFVSLRQHVCPCIEQPEPSAHKDCHGSTSPCLETTKWPPAKAPNDTRCWDGHLGVYFIFWAKPHQRLFIVVLYCCYAMNTDIMNIYELWKSAHSSPSLWGSSPRHSFIASVADTHNLKVKVPRSTGQLCEFLLDPFLPHFERPLLSSDLEVHQFWVL